ncbi:MAG: nuclear transport factor 2 family protein [Proteobacteria bacterium]|nr:nuclear transport factor 2 family protein [Pseudomonadota bacterium]HQR03555.1 nuclear transport factor 2 family protein [Rhodocyclaceae bacterium]
MSNDDLAQLRRDIQMLKDAEAIRNLKGAYFRCADTSNLTEIATLFHDDVEVKFVGGTYEWDLKGKKAYLEALTQGFNPNVVAQHHGHTPEIHVLNEREATGTWYLYDNFWNLGEGRYTYGTALYRDYYVKENGRWLIRRTAYKRVYEVVEEMPKDKEPNFTYRWLADKNAKMVE